MKNGLHIDEYDIKRYYLNDELHRVDGPALEYVNGGKYWYLHGKPHRVDGPAAEHPDDSKYWYLHGKRHRVDGPAIELANGEKHWYLNGIQLSHPEEFKNMQEFIQYLNDNEEYSLQWINDINGIFAFIKKPSGKQSRLNAMRWKI